MMTNDEFSRDPPDSDLRTCRAGGPAKEGTPSPEAEMKTLAADVTNSRNRFQQDVGERANTGQ